MSIATLADRIKSKVWNRGPRECHPWLGTIHPRDGDARIWVDAERDSVGVPTALYLARGESIPEGKVVLCCPILKDCCNPDHHSLATKSEVFDRTLWRRGLKRRVPKQPCRKLTDEQIRQIFLSPLPTVALAREHGISSGQVANIRAGRRNRKITEPFKDIQPSHENLNDRKEQHGDK